MSGFEVILWLGVMVFMYYDDRAEGDDILFDIWRKWRGL